MNDSTRRAVRTVLDLVPAFLATLAVLVGVFDLEPETVAKVGTVIGAITVLLAKVRNSLEDSGFIPALLKAPASDGVDPVPNDGGYTRVGLVIGVLLLCLGIYLAVGGYTLAGIIAAVAGLVLLGFF